ncbi:MAG: FAD-dependent oxidoreductase [Peptococcaceae bacterium]|nr:FAD-dependent oxidoreductase [Peptococcaceae bacterium]
MGSDYKNVFTPIKIKGVDFKNRVECAPNVPNLSSPDGYFSRELVEYYRTFARGGAAVVTVGDSCIDPQESRNHISQVFLHTDLAITGLNSYVYAVESYGAIASIEINHGGRFGSYEYTGNVPYGPSPVVSGIELEIARRQGRSPIGVREMSHEHIQLTVQKFADAAYRCKRAGFKMVMIHGGHNNLLAQFVSPLTNKRLDIYGGSLENRARFVIDVLDAIRKKCGPEMILEYRISGSELVEGGMTQEETIEFAKMIQDKIDILHISGGMYAEPGIAYYMVQPCYVDRMYNVHFAEAFKKEIKIPIATVGSIMNLDNAEMILRNGWADFVAFTRPFLADPEFLRKCAAGRKEDVRPCIRCHFCSTRVHSGWQLRCAVNPMTGRAVEFPRGVVEKAPVKKKVVVVGGGAAGMQAARTAVERGHEVVLYEKNGYLGGSLKPATALDIKKDLREYYEWAVRQTEKCGAKIHLNTDVTAELIKKEQPDALIIAVGASPIIPRVKGIDRPNVHWAGDVDEGKCEVGKKVIVVGGGLVGFETAIGLGRQGKEVTIIEMLGEEGLMNRGINPLDKGAVFKMAEEAGVKIICNTKLEEVLDTGIRCINRDLQIVEYECDTVVLAVGMRSRTDKVEELRRVIPETEVYIVGDARQPESVGEAVHSAFAAANQI